MHILLLQCVYSYINLYFVRVFIVGLAAFFNVLSSSSTVKIKINMKFMVSKLILLSMHGCILNVTNIYYHHA